MPQSFHSAACDGFKNKYKIITLFAASLLTHHTHGVIIDSSTKEINMNHKQADSKSISLLRKAMHSRSNSSRIKLSDSTWLGVYVNRDSDFFDWFHEDSSGYRRSIDKLDWCSILMEKKS